MDPPLSEGDLVLGIDLGTTTVKICVINAVSKEIVLEKARKTNADISTADLAASYANAEAVKDVVGFSEQDVRKIWTTVNGLLAGVDDSLTGKIKAIGLCGQQHGVMFWNQASCDEEIEDLHKDIPVGCSISSLITWQDQRCSREFLDSLPHAEPKQVVATGYGSASIFWLAKNAPDHLNGYDRAGTVMDFFATILARGRSMISPQNAETWGFFDRFEMSWNWDRLKESAFPIDLLPAISGQGCFLFVGHLRATARRNGEDVHLERSWHGITKRSVYVGVAYGDLQTSFIATVQNDDDAVLNFSTSSQVSFIRTRTDLPIPSSCDVRTYFGRMPDGVESHAGRELIVAPSLNGGNVLTFFVHNLKEWVESIGGTVNEEDIWPRVIALANEKNWAESNDPTVKPTLYGERFDANLRATVGNLSLVNADLGSLIRGILKGVIDNLEAMLPADYLRQSNVKRIVLTGSLFRTFPQLVQHVSRVFGLPIVLKEDTRDAAFGAALAVSTMTKDAWLQYL
ncbi:Sedoheptulokinase [Hypsibius exemplaris]|uniref:Sedoheptulokinase n=1 Tax=Hypsibius exemplaris TaxID=2072580 RepID=A0A9X6NF29_HYPEX|nr:Sedoheptulokinase [Hypsibius exemplaris]